MGLTSMVIPTQLKGIPSFLREICEEVNRLRLERSNVDTLKDTWEGHVHKARGEILGINIEDNGEVMYLGKLSPGCRACKDGSWDCVFTTVRCNLNCDFCYSPHTISEDYTGSAFGLTPEEISANYTRTYITGIGFTGGEPFIDAERLFNWIARFKNLCPEKYYWIYTNGLLANEDKIRQLGELGVNEIRFNLAATGYNHPDVLSNLSVAARIIPMVTVEIPAIPKHASILLSSLKNWCALGVRFLNLHELIYEANTDSISMPGANQDIVMTDGHRTGINPESRALTLAVMKTVKDEGLPLSVNDCSLQSKIRQLRGRRRSMAPLVKRAYEKLVGDELYESYCAYCNEAEYFFFYPDSVSRVQLQYPDYQIVRLVRTAPLSVNQKGRWIAFERI